MISKYSWFVHPNLPTKLNIFFVLLQVIHFIAAIFRMDLILAQSKDSLKCLKLFYDLKNDHKNKLNCNVKQNYHKEIIIRLNQPNYKKSIDKFRCDSSVECQNVNPIWSNHLFHHLNNNLPNHKINHLGHDGTVFHVHILYLFSLFRWCRNLLFRHIIKCYSFKLM